MSAGRVSTITLLALTAIVVAATLTFDGGDLDAQELRFFRIGTGSTAGTYFPVGSLIASAISNPPGSRPCEEGGSCGVPGLIAAAQATAGSVANVEAIQNGEFESGLAQADVAHWAYYGEAFYKHKARVAKLRAIANLYPESVHLVARKGSGIAAVPDLAGKRVSLDTAGAGSQVDAYLILEAFGLTEKDMFAVYARPNQAIDMMLEDKLDAFFFVGGYPATAIAELATNDKIDLIPVAGNEVRALREKHTFFAADAIPADTYNGMGRIETISVGAQWVVSAEVDADLVYALTKALWHPNNRHLLDSGHVKARLIRLETALSGISIPLHDGAKRYYKEIGLIE